MVQATGDGQTLLQVVHFSTGRSLIRGT